ncbi:DUF924 family protein [Sulfitobacter guttiformis]|uniref:Uncharacterized protein (DUF924 family) n=1 Tax=Sulfitobacter guttiformis TaxID=74349 RepID=A0A420DIQ3_9RHOB|nr:DUF924 family protein [Sulfitobacter guttiformis]KIN72130.1 hypothetical protein Z949_1299 [Sulfitobacter guttiformis KCTC 32187]RKE94094.1 uncharacterized protein (DUF924 family) [Sulfitobacter guttiformis]
MVAPEQVLEFWLDKVGPKGWYAVDEAVDAEIRERFMTTWEAARAGGLSLWLTYPSGALAYLILTDQFSRNMFRDNGTAFALDTAALGVAKLSICKGWDLKIDAAARQFFYLPLMHSENLCDQDRCIRLMVERMPPSAANNLLQTQAHREVIRQFGRFPYRNDALSRQPTRGEQDYAAKGGYGHTLRQLQADVAA